MKHILFPTVADADAFIKDLQNQGAVRPELGQMTATRRTASTTATTADVAPMEGGTAEDAGAGAVKGTVAGAITGVAAAVIGTAATIGTGGLALPVVLGMAALGSGVGAAVGGVGGAAGVDETGMDHRAELDDDHYDRLDRSISDGGRAVAVDDSVPMNVLEPVMLAHHGQLV